MKQAARTFKETRKLTEETWDMFISRLDNNYKAANKLSASVSDKELKHVFWAAIKQQDAKIQGLLMGVIMEAKRAFRRANPEYVLPGDREWAQVIDFDTLSAAVREVVSTMQGTLDFASQTESATGKLSAMDGVSEDNGSPTIPMAAREAGDSWST